MRIRRSQPTWTDDIHLHTSSRWFRCHHHHWVVVMPVVRRMLHHAASKLAYIALSSAISCRSSIFKVVSPPLGWSTLSYGLNVVTRDVHWSCWRLLMCPSQDPFICVSHCWLYLCLCRSLSSLPDPDVDISVLVYNVEDTSFHYGSCDCKFVLCLFCECPGVCTMSKLATHMRYLYTCVLRQIAMLHLKIHRISYPGFGVCRPACHYSSLYRPYIIFFLVTSSDAVVVYVYSSHV